MQHNPVTYLQNAIRELEPLERAADDRRDFETAERLIDQLRDLTAAFERAQPFDAAGVVIKLQVAADIARAEDVDGMGAWLGLHLSRAARKVERHGVAAAWGEMYLLLKHARRINGDAAELVLSVFPVLVDGPGVQIRSFDYRHFEAAA